MTLHQALVSVTMPTKQLIDESLCVGAGLFLCIGLLLRIAILLRHAGTKSRSSTTLRKTSTLIERQPLGGPPSDIAGRQLGYLAVGELKPDSRNPRRHDRQQIRAIARSIDAFGFNAPILIDRAKRIVAGHGRLEAAKLSGLTHVPVIRLDHLSEAQSRAYMLADNKLTDRSSWDEHMLALQLQDLSKLALDFDIEATGFELPEIDFSLQSLDEPDADDENDAFEPVAGPPVSRRGDLWQLGDHRLVCGSALEADAYETLLDGNKATLVFTDPPYNVPINGHVCGSGLIKHREFAMASGEMSEDAFTTFLSSAFATLGHHTRAGAVIFACMDWRHLREITSAGQRAGFELLNLCVWVKSNGGMGSFYRSQHELVFVFKNGREQHVNNVQLGRFGRNRTNV